MSNHPFDTETASHGRHVSFATILEDITDTTFSMKLEDYIRIATTAGFERLMEDDVGEEKLIVFGCEEGSIILVVDTYRGERNSARVQLRWTGPEFPSVDDVELESIPYGNGTAWIVSFDARKDFLAKLALLETSDGTFLNNWWNSPEGSVEDGLPRLYLEQEETHIARSFSSRGDRQRAVEQLNTLRMNLLPALWKQRLDIEGRRSVRQAMELG